MRGNYLATHELAAGPARRLRLVGFNAVNETMNETANEIENPASQKLERGGRAFAPRGIRAEIEFEEHIE
jgi:hypothetical protein